MKRRDFLKALAAMGIYGAFSPFASNKLVGNTIKKSSISGSRVKSVIEIWVWGGPSQLETFDPKPKAGFEFNGGFGAIPTNVPGVEVSQFMPKLAQHADKYSIIRSMTHKYFGHEAATYLMQTGRVPGGGRTYPAIGALFARFKGHEYQGKLPPYIALTINKGRFSENGFLSDRYRPLATGGNPAAQRFVVDGFVPPGDATAREIKERQEFARQLDVLGSDMPDHPEFAAFTKAGDAAQEIINGSAAQAFNLALESEETRNFYGRNKFGQSCLVARRLVEAGVPYITINATGWDTHIRHFETLNRIAPEMDQAVAALLSDLHQKKLLDQTIVWWSGEFGRTPKVDTEPPWNGGRNHFATCFSAMVAGGGFAGGKVIGESDATAANVVNRPVAPQDLLGSIYELAGINPDGDLPNPIGLKTTILPQESKAGRLREIYM